MRIAINGTGIAGPTLAWWLRHHGFEPVLFEKAARMRTGGYFIDFWGTGYDIAEKMGLVEAIHEQGYAMKSLDVVDDRGRVTTQMPVDTFRKLLDGRFTSIRRGDLAALLFDACDGIKARFGTHIVGIDQRERDVIITTNHGDTEAFDLVVGADGLHSAVRRLVFGPEARFGKFLGFMVSTVRLSDYEARDELAYVTRTIPGRHLARIALRDGGTVFAFIWRADALSSEHGGTVPASDAEKRTLLRRTFADMGWEAPQVLARLDEVDGIYLDRVSQIHLDAWSRGRVALIGDAAACASLLAGEGSGLAMIEAYTLAGELARAARSGGAHASAFTAYEERLREFVSYKQRTAPQLASFFAPRSRLGIGTRDLVMKLSRIPFVARAAVGSSLTDDLSLPDYASEAMSPADLGRATTPLI